LLLWKNHPIWLKYLSEPDTVIILVFDFFDDTEVANPLGSHATVHKVGCKYTIIKGYKLSRNDELDNILLNMVFLSSDQSAMANKDLLAAYLSEMTYLETRAIQVSVDGSIFHVYVCLVQVIGDNLGLNSIVAFVESFTASFHVGSVKSGVTNFLVVSPRQMNSIRMAAMTLMFLKETGV